MAQGGHGINIVADIQGAMCSPTCPGGSTFPVAASAQALQTPGWRAGKTAACRGPFMLQHPTTALQCSMASVQGATGRPLLQTQPQQCFAACKPGYVGPGSPPNLLGGLVECCDRALAVGTSRLAMHVQFSRASGIHQGFPASLPTAL